MSEWRLSARGRKRALTVHVAASVALLGSVATTLVLALTAATTDDDALARAGYELMRTLTLALNIPLALTALVSGIVVGLGTRWGVLRHRWVATKLALLLAVALIGALVIGRGVEAALAAPPGLEPESAQWRVVGGAAAAAAALVAATALSVYKPGGRLRARRGGVDLARSGSTSS